MAKIKSASFKMRFPAVALAASLLFCGFYLIWKNKMNNHDSSRAVTAILTGKLTFPLVPENISTIPLYHVHTNLWGTLLKRKGEPGLAKLVATENEERLFKFELLPDVRMSNGRKITSADVDFSIRRLMAKQEPGHFSAKSLIDKIELISETQFSIALKERTASFLFLLSTPEMGIVPKEACDADGKITDLQVTSGAFTVEGTPTYERIVFKKNPHFLGNDSQSPTTVAIHFEQNANQLAKSHDENQADLIELYEGSSIVAFDHLKDRNDIAYKITRPSYSVFLTTNSKALSRAERLSLSELLREKLQYPLNPDLEKPSNQILPPGTFGGLQSQSPIPRLEKRHYPKKLRIATFGARSLLADKIIEVLKGARVDVELVPFGDANSYDIAFLGQGMNTDFPEIEFYLNMLSPWAPIFPTSDEKSLIMSTIHSASLEERMLNLQKIGQALLDDARVIPLLVRSYVHVYRKGRVDLSQVTTYDGDIPFWKMRVFQ